MHYAPCPLVKIAAPPLTHDEATRRLCRKLEQRFCEFRQLFSLFHGQLLRHCASRLVPWAADAYENIKTCIRNHCRISL